MCRAIAVFLEHLLWDAYARHPRGFAITSSPGDAYTQNGPELIIKLDPITKSTACLPVNICSAHWNMQEHRCMLSQSKITFSSSFSSVSLELLHSGNS